MMRSARRHTSAAESASVAPAPSYERSSKPLPAPAPFSTTTWCPCATNAATPVGVIATRFSSSLISLGTPTIISKRQSNAARRLTPHDDGEKRPADEKGEAADRRDRAEPAWAAHGEEIETAGKDHDAEDKEPARRRNPRPRPARRRGRYGEQRERVVHVI